MMEDVRQTLFTILSRRLCGRWVKTGSREAKLIIELKRYGGDGNLLFKELNELRSVLADHTQNSSGSN